jgi:hypothetical protein
MSRSFADTAIEFAPGVALSAAVAGAAYLAAPFVARAVPIPAMVLALVIGIALNPLASQPAVLPGMAFCVRMLLRWAVALLGLRVALADIAALGLATGVLVVLAMIVTLWSGFFFARMSGRQPGFAHLRDHDRAAAADLQEAGRDVHLGHPAHPLTGSHRGVRRHHAARYAVPHPRGVAATRGEMAAECGTYGPR